MSEQSDNLGAGEKTPQYTDDQAERFLENVARIMAGDVAACATGCWEKITLDDYTLENPIGAGGAGVVFAATSKKTRGSVVVKVFPNVRRGIDSPAWPCHEVWNAAQLNDPRIVLPIEYGHDEHFGFDWIVMERLEGESLDKRLERDFRLPWQAAFGIAAQVLQALSKCAKKTVVHADIKPGNIFLTDTGIVKITDFGTSRLLHVLAAPQSPEQGGTPQYMAPEQSEGDPRPQSDLYSLGVTLYQMLTGELPYTGARNLVELKELHANSPIPDPRKKAPELDLPRACTRIIERALAKKVEHRYQTAAEFRWDLEKALRGPRRKLVGVLAAVGAIGALLALWLPRPWDRPPVQPSPAGAAQELPVRYRGEVDIRIWRKQVAGAIRLRLGDPGALPLYEGDQFRIYAHVETPAYLYLFWINTQGKIIPVYPWEPGKWSTRPAQNSEKKVTKLSLPPQIGLGYTIAKGTEGMETLLLLGRETPLPLDDTQLRARFGELPPQRLFQDRLSAVWFENGQIVEHDAARKRNHFETSRIDDPVLHLQGLLQERLQPLASLSSAVSFARLGKKE